MVFLSCQPNLTFGWCRVDSLESLRPRLDRENELEKQDRWTVGGLDLGAARGGYNINTVRTYCTAADPLEIRCLYFPDRKGGRATCERL
jgi:hypothetical protein